MKTINSLKYFFTILGAGMLIGTFFMYQKTSEFLETAITSEAIVIKLVDAQNSSSNSVMYAPLVQFLDENENKIEFLSSSSSNPPSYTVGEKVEVVYNQENPNEAKIKGFFSIWGGVTILGILGVIFFGIGRSIFLYYKRKSNTLEYLKLNGTTIESNLQSVEINNSLSINGKSPFQIVSHWQNPITSKLHIFTSDHIWFNPSDYIKNDKIKVLIDENNPKRYSIDLSFLPEVE